MRVLVTGASGYLGLHVLESLVAAGHAVTAVTRRPARLGPWIGHPSVAVREADLEVDGAVERMVGEHAACVHAALIWGEPHEDLELRDTRATAKLFDAAGRAGVSRALYVSSTAVHRPFRERMTEADRLTTTDVYGATKAAGELFLWTACAAHAMDGVVVRPGPMVGPPAFPGASFRTPARLEAFVRAARAGDPIHVEEGTGRQFVDVRDVANVIARLVAADGVNGTYLCVARELSTWESLAREIVARLRSPSRVVVEPRAAGTPQPRFDTGKLRAHLGVELESDEAIEAHLAHLAGMGSATGASPRRRPASGPDGTGDRSRHRGRG